MYLYNCDLESLPQVDQLLLLSRRDWHCNLAFNTADWDMLLITCSYAVVKILQNWQLLQPRTLLSAVLGVGIKILAVRGWRADDGAGEQCEEEEVAERSHYELATTTIPHPPVLHGGRRRWKSQQWQWSWALEEGNREKVFRFLAFKSIWTGNKLNLIN